MSLLASIVIPTYNRRDRVCAAIDSALAWRKLFPGLELIVVDDASADGTIEELAERYRTLIANGIVKLHRLEENCGATAAKNVGAKHAVGQWIIFLDSDDVLIERACSDVVGTLERNSSVPIVFFRCVLAGTDELIGESFRSEVPVTIKDCLVSWKWGECLPAVRRDVHLSQPYIEELRGHEGIAYARQIRECGPAIVSPIVARAYDSFGLDRLSTWASRVRRGGEMAAGFALIASEFRSDIGFGGFVRSGLRCYWYRAASALFGE